MRNLTLNSLINFFRGSHPLKDKMGIKGRVTLTLKDASGKIKKIVRSNTVENAGIYAVMDQLLASPTLGKPTHGGVGTGTPTAGNLQTPVAPRVALDSKLRSNAVVTMVFTLPAGTGTGSLTEAGIFDALTSGNCLATTSFTAIPKGAGDSLVITWTWTLAV